MKVTTSFLALLRCYLLNEVVLGTLFSTASYTHHLVFWFPSMDYSYFNFNSIDSFLTYYIIYSFCCCCCSSISPSTRMWTPERQGYLSVLITDIFQVLKIFPSTWETLNKYLFHEWINQSNTNLNVKKLNYKMAEENCSAGGRRKGFCRKGLSIASQNPKSIER